MTGVSVDESDLVAEDDAAAGEIVRRNLDGHAVSLKHTNAEATHVAAKRREHRMSVGELHTKRCVGEDFSNLTFELNRFFFRHSWVGESQNIRQSRHLVSGRGLWRRCRIAEKRAIARPLSVSTASSHRPTGHIGGFFCLSTLFPTTPPRMPPTAAPIRPPLT